MDDTGPEALLPAPSSPATRHFRATLTIPSDWQIRKARKLDLMCRASSPAAVALCDAALAIVLQWEKAHKPRGRKRQPKEAHNLRIALEAIVGEVLRLWSADKRALGYRSTDPAKFDGLAVKPRPFGFLADALHQTELVVRWRVFRRTLGKGENGPASRYWPGQRLLDLAEECGVSPASVRTDFARDEAAYRRTRAPRIRQPIRLKRIVNKAKTLGLDKPFNATDPIPMRLADEVQVVNAFAATFNVEGCAPPQWSRTFHEDWRLGGRWYSHGPNGWHYQSMPEARRLASIRINGEPIAEIDVKACFLVLALAALGLPVPDEDPYDVGLDLPRKAIKVFINASLGKGSPLQQWPDDEREGMAALGHKTPSAIAGPVLARYPFLRNDLWRIAGADFLHLQHLHPRILAIHRLTNTEATIITEVMRALRERGILSLPMHDALIVPASVSDLARDLLLGAGERVAKVRLRLTVDFADAPATTPA